MKFDERPQDELSRWVSRHAQAAGKSMDRQVIQHLLSVADHGMRSLRNELAKIFAHSGDTVTAADVDAVTVRTVESRIYDLADALFRDDAGAAVDVLRELLERYPDTMVFDTVYGTFARLYRVRAAADAGLAPDDAAAALGMKPYAVKKNLTLARESAARSAAARAGTVPGYRRARQARLPRQAAHSRGFRPAAYGAAARRARLSPGPVRRMKRRGGPALCIYLPA